MMEIARIILFVKDLERMLAFYEQTLGLQRTGSPDDNDEFVSLRAGAIQLSLHEIPTRYAKGIEISEPPVARTATPIKWAFQVDDVAETRAEFESRGVNMRKMQTAGEIRFCDGIDPEGNVFQISDRP